MYGSGKCVKWRVLFMLSGLPVERAEQWVCIVALLSSARQARGCSCTMIACHPDARTPGTDVIFYQLFKKKVTVFTPLTCDKYTLTY